MSEGDLEVRLKEDAYGELRELQVALNRLGSSILEGQQELQQNVDQATEDLREAAGRGTQVERMDAPGVEAEMIERGRQLQGRARDIGPCRVGDGYGGTGVDHLAGLGGGHIVRPRFDAHHHRRLSFELAVDALLLEGAARRLRRLGVVAEEACLGHGLCAVAFGLCAVADLDVVCVSGRRGAWLGGARVAGWDLY